MKSTLFLLATLANAAPADLSWQTDLSAPVRGGAAKVYGLVHNALSAPTPRFFGDATKNTPYFLSACNYVRVESPPGYISYGFQVGLPVSGEHEENEKFCDALRERISHPMPRGRGDIEITKWRCENDGHGNRWIGFRTEAVIDERMMVGRVKEGAFPNVYWLSREHCAAQKDELRRVKDQREGHVKRHEVPLPGEVGKHGIPPPVIGYGRATCIAEYYSDSSARFNLNIGLPFFTGEACEKVRWAIEHPAGKEFFKLPHWECSPAGYGYTWISIGARPEQAEGITKSLEEGYAQAGYKDMKFDKDDICKVREKGEERKKERDAALLDANGDQKPT
ncbi:Hypothetical predicted protein [Lecanosticta acicola]|uniref:Uncharacterized protein n=1 Tax=Lecanosticta acicola TaxID=111012 RepID=A0AAI8Z9P6_9PEZI|nr:Hypothetical predicted protein [Lecanosticta acicola]